MRDFILEAGWGIWPVIVFGAISLALSVRYTFRPQRDLLLLVIGFSIATLLLGALGFATGVQASATFAEHTANARWMFVVGLRESLNNVVASLVVVATNVLLTTRGAYRDFPGSLQGGPSA